MRSLIVSGLFNVTAGNTYKPDDSVRGLCEGGALKDMITFIQYVGQHPNLMRPDEFITESSRKRRHCSN